MLIYVKVYLSFFRLDATFLANISETLEKEYLVSKQDV